VRHASVAPCESATLFGAFPQWPSRPPTTSWQTPVAPRTRTPSGDRARVFRLFAEGTALKKVAVSSNAVPFPRSRNVTSKARAIVQAISDNPALKEEVEM